ncbi:MAG: multiheme c-type cytochrome [Myxococcota bacterium]
MALLAALGLASLLGCGAAALPHGADAASCGTCHAAQHAAWSTTAHASSAASPVLLALLPRVEAAWGPSARARCVACHAPGFGGDDGIGCVACHGAVGNRGMANGALVVSVDAPLAGTRAVRNAAHDVAPRGFLRASALCGTCHEVHGPGLLEEPTHAEFTASRFTDGDDCITCHVARDGDRHALVSVDPPWGASGVKAARAASATTALWAKALSLSVTVVPGTAVVRLENTGAGHAVPTGATHLRDAWVDVQLTGAGGARVTVPRVMELGAQLTREGREVPLVTDADAVTPRSLAPGEVRAVSVRLPSGTVAVRAVLSARAVRAAALDALGLSALAGEVPVLGVAEAEVR